MTAFLADLKRRQKWAAVPFAFVLFAAATPRDAVAADQARIVVAANGSHSDNGHAAKKEKTPEEPAIPQSSHETLTPGDQYCAKIGDIAVSAQYAQQRKALANAQEQIDARIKTLSEKSEEYKLWSKKREDFMKKATDGLLEIYSKMKPESAATQLVAINQVTAAAIIAKLPPKSASAILAEMDATHAARLSSMLAASAELGEAKPAAPAKEQP